MIRIALNYMHLVECDPKESLAPKTKAVGSFSKPTSQHNNT